MKPLVKVIWQDAEDFKEKGWASEEEAAQFTREVMTVTSWGYLVSKSRSYVSIAADYSDPDTYGRIMKIPKKMILSITEQEFPAAPNPV